MWVDEDLRFEPRKKKAKRNPIYREKGGNWVLQKMRVGR